MNVRRNLGVAGAASLLALQALGCHRSDSRARLDASTAQVITAQPTVAAKPVPPSAQRVTPMQTPTFEGSQAPAFAFEYASSLRNSHVSVKRKRFTQFARHPVQYAQADWGTPRERQPPFVLVVSPDGHHGVLSSQGKNEAVDERGVGFPGHGGDAIAFDDVVFVGGTPITWSGALAPDENAVTGMAQVEVRRIDARRFAAVASYPQPPGDRPFRAALGVFTGSRAAGAVTYYGSVEGTGVAAIGADLTAVVALEDGRLQVYPPEPDAQGHLNVAAERNVGVAAKWLSIVGAYIMLVSRDGAGSKLQAFTGDTTPVYALSVPFEVLQPAIAGAGKRVYLAGQGLAAIDDAKLSWLHPSEERIYASSFEDGSLALATGKRLDFVKLDGTVDQTFEAAEPLVAPPAIAGDGSVWAASASAIYIAR